MAEEEHLVTKAKLEDELSHLTSSTPSLPRSTHERPAPSPEVGSNPALSLASSAMSVGSDPFRPRSATLDARPPSGKYIHLVYFAYLRSL
jgi:hypothetical protein